MFRFLNNLCRDFRTTSAAPRTRRAPRRAMLRLEGLEDRLVMSTVNPLGSTVSPTPIVRTGSLPPMSTASQNGSTLSIAAAAEITRISSDGAGHIEVNDVYLHAQFNISSINAVYITGLGNGGLTTNVEIDDSNGMPFAPGTTISLYGSGTAPTNLLGLGGTMPLSGNETYVPGSVVHLTSPQGLSLTTNTPATLSLSNLNINFRLYGSFGGGIYDNFPITGTLDVQTSGTQVQLVSSAPGGDQYFSGLGNGAGSYLGFGSKSSVTLDTFAANASIFLDDADAAAGESYFTVNMQAANETTTLDQTPKNVTTIVNIDSPATNANVALWGNFGPVTIDGDITTGVIIGYPLNSTGPITSGIEANVTVEGASYLEVTDSGNVSTFENVKVTEQSITGTGLFGNNSVTLAYGGVATVDINTGQLADGYTVAPSSFGEVFTSAIFITSDSYMAFHATVDVNPASHLNLEFINENLKVNAVLDVVSTGVVELPGTLPSGVINVLFAGHANSQISYFGFGDVFQG